MLQISIVRLDPAIADLEGNAALMRGAASTGRALGSGGRMRSAANY